MTNMEIRLEARRNYVPLWKIARSLQIGENTLYRWLREELTDERRNKILNAITQLK
ncbi:hypothetical protein FACS1894111_10250 [Clostridia bacterium]|nr:hypothetical protein FACS1894111_10250 [Clostridia bacterium]